MKQFYSFQNSITNTIVQNTKISSSKFEILQQICNKNNAIRVAFSEVHNVALQQPLQNYRRSLKNHFAVELYHCMTPDSIKIKQIFLLPCV